MAREMELRYVNRVTDEQIVNRNLWTKHNLACHMPVYEHIEAIERILQQYVNGEWRDIPTAEGIERL